MIIFLILWINLNCTKFTYDSLGRRLTDSDNNNGNKVVTSTYTYDRLHRNLTDTQKIGTGASLTNAKAFNAFGDVTQVTLPSGKVITQTYTTIHQPSSIVSNIGNGTETIARYEYNYESTGTDKRPLVKKKVLATGTGIKTDYSYDAMSRLITNNSKDSLNNTVVGFEHTYDLLGNRITDKHLHRLQDSETYGYDTALRFNDYKRGTIGGTPSFTQAYTLDKLANWTSFNNNGTVENRTHNVMNEITSINSQALTHDIKGNLTTNKNGDKYYWDKLNRLVEVRDAGNNSIAFYYYNAKNLRVQKTTTAGTEQYYYSGLRVVVETDGNQAVTKEYIHGSQYIDEVLTVTTGGQTYFYLYDLRFNVYGLTDINGNIVERIRYQGYGKAEFLDASFSPATPFVNQPYTYTGQRFDSETGLIYFRQRYFDNDLGRFISRDPIGYVDGMSLYRGYFVVLYIDFNGTEIKFTGEDDAMVTTEDQLEQLKKDDPALKTIIEALEKSPNVHEIHCTDLKGNGNTNTPTGDSNDANNGKGTGSKTEYDPYDKNGEDGKRDPRVGLAHELSHAYDADKGIRNSDINPKSGVKINEEKAVDIENKIRAVTGDKKRTTYGKKKVEKARKEDAAKKAEEKKKNEDSQKDTKKDSKKANKDDEAIDREDIAVLPCDER